MGIIVELSNIKSDYVSSVLPCLLYFPIEQGCEFDGMINARLHILKKVATSMRILLLSGLM